MRIAAASRRAAGTRRARRGAALILFAMLVFVFMAIAALTVDIGLAHLTQQQMQVAVDTAAIEGVRYRNLEPAGPTASAWMRGKRVSDHLRLQFDDDLAPTLGGLSMDGMGFPSATPPDGPDQLQLGAGPAFSVRGVSAGSLAGGELVLGEPAVIDDPVLAPGAHNQFPSLANPRWGDVVVGRFLADASPQEDSTYGRQDFVPAQPLPSADTQLDLGVLVRMRRTPPGNPLDEQAPFSSRLPALPLLFARGTPIHSDPSSGWDPRRDGLTVRSVAIAAAFPALRAGSFPRTGSGEYVVGRELVRYGERPMMGLYPVALEWRQWVLGRYITPSSVNPNDPGDDLLLVYYYPSGAQAGTLYFQGEQVGIQVHMGTLNAGRVISVGEALAPWSGEPLRDAAPMRRIGQEGARGFIALYEREEGTGTLRVIGFALGKVTLFEDGGAGAPSSLVVQGPETLDDQVRCLVARDNASSSLMDPLPSLTPQEWERVLALNRALAYEPPNPDLSRYDHTRPGVLFAPALGR